MVEPTDSVLWRVRNHIAQMAPNQKERRGGKLLIEAADEIEALEKEVLCLEKALTSQKSHA